VIVRRSLFRRRSVVTGSQYTPGGLLHMITVCLRTHPGANLTQRFPSLFREILGSIVQFVL